MDARFLAVAGLKGGTGKTALAVNLAAGLALRRRRVLLLDLDPSGSSTYHLGGTTGRTLADALDGRPLADCAHPVEGIPGLLLAPSDPHLAAWDRKPERFPVDLVRTLAGLPAGIDLVLLDCPPSVGALVRGALAVLPGGAVLAPVQARGADLLGFAALCRLVEEIADQNPALHLAGIVPTMVRKNKLAEEVVEALRRQHGRLVLPGIRDAVAVARAFLDRRPVQLTAPRSAVAGDFATLTTKILTLTR
jgi:chromosome partitioning protein